MNAIETATEMSKAMETRKRDDNKTYYVLKDGSPSWMTDIIHKVHGDKLPDDTTYEFISDALDIISDCQDDDEVNDRISEIEADVYTSDLTAWLNKRNDHVYYLTEALEQGMGFTDGFQLLSYAQTMHKQEVARDLWEAIKEYADDTDDETEEDTD